MWTEFEIDRALFFKAPAPKKDLGPILTATMVASTKSQQTSDGHLENFCDFLKSLQSKGGANGKMNPKYMKIGIFPA